MQEKPFYSLGTEPTDPHTRRVFVDGTGGDVFRAPYDIELSHWIPNRTNERYKAGTSVEICFNYLQAHPELPYDAVINNHLDLDGILSAFVMCYPKVAQQHIKTLIQAAEAGDFWGWVEGKAFTLFQELSLLYQRLAQDNISLQKAYEQCFSCVLTLLSHPHTPTPEETLLKTQLLNVNEGKIQRQAFGPHFVSYWIPKSMTQGQERAFLEIPYPNEVISDRLAFWPHVRNYRDAQKMQLLAIETEKGIHYDLWCPGYGWADTKGLWLPKDLASSLKKHPPTLCWPALEKCLKDLTQKEPGPCIWKMFPRISLFGKENPRRFPVIASTLSPQHQKKESQLPFHTVLSFFQLLCIN